MKKILILLFVVISNVCFSQTKSIKITMKNNLDEIYKDTVLISILKKINFDFSQYTFVSLSEIQDSTDVFEVKKINFTISNKEIIFSDVTDITQSVSSKNKNCCSKKSIPRKYMFCYRTLEKDENNKYKIVLYSLE